MASVEFASFDTTLRDGAQALDENEHQFKRGAKPDIAAAIANLGVDVIEAGFPATPDDADEVREVARSVGNHQREVINWRNGQKIDTSYSSIPAIAGLSRATPGDIEATWDAIKDAARPRIHTFISVDDEHMRAKFPGASPDDVLAMGCNAIRLAKDASKHRDEATVEFSAEASTTADEKFLESVVKMGAEEGVDVLNMPDTVGQRDPFWMYEFYTKILSWALPINPDVTISSHPHNDLGLAVANSIALVRAATDYAAETQQRVRVQAEGTICSLGERAGNADLIAIMGGLFKFTQGYRAPVDFSLNPQRAVQTATEVMHAASYEVPPKSPIVGSETNTHRSGIHSDGVIKGGFEMYTPHDPRFWGHNQAAVHETGRYQGRNGTQAAATQT